MCACVSVCVCDMCAHTIFVCIITDSQDMNSFFTQSVYLISKWWMSVHDLEANKIIRNARILEDHIPAPTP